jgi:histidine triad (HIT) family protein
MSDFYCDEVLSGKTPVQTVAETARVLAFHHTRPSYPVHIVVIPKTHIPSLVDFAPGDDSLLLELLGVIRDVARQVTSERGACRVITNLGDYQESKHLHWHVVSGERLPAITLAD